MINIIFIVGPPGSGKSYGIRTLNSKRTCVINADRKPLTFPGASKNYITNGNMFYEKKLIVVEERIKWAYDKKGKDEKSYVFDNCIWDTANSSMLDVEMSHKGTLTFNEWYEFAKDVYKILDNMKDLTTRKEPFNMFVLFHEGTDHQDRRNVLTGGKKLVKVQLEGMVNWAFFTQVAGEGTNPTFKLETMNYGTSLAKQCANTFPPLIPNDFQLIVGGIESFNKGEQVDIKIEE